MIGLEEALEGSSPLARKVKAMGPADSREELVARLRAAAAGMSELEAIGTLNAHPRIGERPDRLSAHSLREQGADLVPELDRLNAEYEQKFGFRFVVFVNRRPKSEIVKVLRARLRRSREEELREGLEAIVAIAEDRLKGA